MSLGIDWDEEAAVEEAARQEKASKARNTATVAAEPSVANAVAPPVAASSTSPTVAAAPPAPPPATTKAPQSFAESIIRKTEPYWNPIHLNPGVEEFNSYKDVDPYATGAHALGEFLTYWHGVRPVIGGIGTRINKSIVGIDPTIKAQIAATNATNESKEKIAAMKYGQAQGPDRPAVPTPSGRIEPTFDTTPLPDSASPNSPEAIATNAVKQNPLDAYSQEKHGFTLAELEASSGGPLTKTSDIDLVANSMKNGRGMTVNTLPGAVSNQPVGIPNAVSPMNKLTVQPPTPQMIQPKPLAGATPPTPVNVAPPAPPAAPVDLVAAAQSGQDMSQPIKEDVAHMVQEADKTPVVPPKGMKEQYKKSKSQPIGPGGYNYFASQVGHETAPTRWSEQYGEKNVPHVQVQRDYSDTRYPPKPNPTGKKTGGAFGTPKFIPEYIKGGATLGGMGATAAVAAVPALAAAAYHAYSGNKEKVDQELGNAWDSLKSVITMPVDVAKAAGKGDFGPFKDMLMSLHPAAMLLNETNKHDEDAIQRMIQSEKAGAGQGQRGVPPPIQR